MNLLHPNPHSRAAAFAEEVLAKIPDVRPLRYRLLLVVGARGTGKTLCLREVAHHTDRHNVANIGIELSRRLLDLTERERPLRVEELLGQIIAGTSDPALLDNLEVLFEPKLQVDPLALLQSLSRDRTVVAAWPGAISGGQLHYAEPGLPEHRRYPTRELGIVALDSTAAR